MSNKSRTSGGIGFTGLLTIVFIVLKLTGHIDWSWWWVLSPLWIPVALVVVIIGVGSAVLVVIEERRQTARAGSDDMRRRP